MDDAGRVNPYEHLAFPGTGLPRLVVGERLGAIAGAQTNRLHAPLPNKHLSAERERDKPRQGVVAIRLKLPCNGAVGFIDWLDDSRSTQRGCGATSSEDKKTHETKR